MAANISLSKPPQEVGTGERDISELQADWHSEQDDAGRSRANPIASTRKAGQAVQERVDRWGVRSQNMSLEGFTCTGESFAVCPLRRVTANFTPT